MNRQTEALHKDPTFVTKALIILIVPTADDLNVTKKSHTKGMFTHTLSCAACY